MIMHLSALALAYILDLLFGDPPRFPHPVILFGNMIRFFDKRWNKGRFLKLKGTAMVAILIIVILSVTLILMLFTYSLNPYFGLIIEAVLIWTTIAQKGLHQAASEVEHPLKNKKIINAREKLSYIVGRDTDNLSEKEIVRGTVETVAENTTDAITAPMFWAAIGGAPLAIVYRLINTCDSMVGYKNEKYAQFGWASARLDDIVNYIPARITGFIMIISSPSKEIPMKKAWSVLQRDASKHPSPNSGWGEAAVAAILGVRLGGINYYEGEPSYRTEMGDAIYDLDTGHISKTVTIMKRTSFVFLILMIAGGFIIEFAITRL